MFPIFCFAQNIEIKGIISSDENQTTIAFASLVVVDLQTNLVVNQQVSDKNGRYQFTNLPLGRYIVKASYIGYQAYQSQIIGMDKSSSTILNIRLIPNTNKLKEVVVSSKKQQFNNSIDRKVYNVDQDVMAKSGSASEILQNVPLVQVDSDGNVSLRNSTATILINGKISPIMGKNAAIALQQLPANSIDRIEVITNPSAKYKPDGTGGIINIVLKKNSKRGFNGGITANAGNQDRYNGGLNLNYNPGKINFFGSYNIKKDDRVKLTNNDRVQIDVINGTSTINQDEIRATSRPFSNTASLGFEYSLNEQNSFGLAGNYYFRSMRKNDLTLKSSSDNIGSIANYTRTRKNHEYEKEADATFFYEHIFRKEDQKIRLEYVVSHSPENEDNHYVNTFRIPIKNDELDNTLIKQIVDNKQLTIAYENNLSKNLALEIGYDGQFNREDLDFSGEDYSYITQSFLADAVKTNRFIYNENIQAVYGTVERSWKKFGLLLGVRGEYASLNSLLVTNDTQIPNEYFKVYPTFHLSYDLSERKEFQLNYSRRVKRPEADDLNPFAEYADPTNIKVGNPKLLPEIIHSVELGFQWKNNTVSILPGIYYRYKYNGFTSVTNPLNSTTLITTQQNLANEQAIGADLVFSAKINEKINVNFTPNAFYAEIDAANLGFNARRHIFTWSANLNSSFNISKGTVAQINSVYKAARLTPQGKYLPSFVLNFGARQEVFNKKGSIYFTLSDVFKTQRQQIELNSLRLNQRIFTRSNSRIAYLGVSYNFGIIKKKKDLTFDNSL